MAMAEKRRRKKMNVALYLMVLPGALFFLVFNYLPMFGSLIAFKQWRFGSGGFLRNFLSSPWVGLKNFEYLFKTSDAWLITRNTLAYNALIIALGLVFAVAVAIVMSLLRNVRLAKVYQTLLFMPYFLSWIVVGFFAFSLFSVDKGLINHALKGLGLSPVAWYFVREPWPFILVAFALWKSVGYNSVIYFAAIASIDPTLYEAATVDGASLWQKVRYVTLPSLVPLMTVLTLMAIGRIFYADFGLFYQLPRNSGPLIPVTNVIDTYVYRGLQKMGDIGMSAAAGLYQAVVGFVLVLASNAVVRRVNEENALF
jgi:ABC-type polysaccharide transport system, permease component